MTTFNVVVSEVVDHTWVLPVDADTAEEAREQVDAFLHVKGEAAGNWPEATERQADWVSDHVEWVEDNEEGDVVLR